jgi:hypothetical protein
MQRRHEKSSPIKVAESQIVLWEHNFEVAGALAIRTRDLNSRWPFRVFGKSRKIETIARAKAKRRKADCLASSLQFMSRHSDGDIDPEDRTHLGEWRDAALPVGRASICKPPGCSQ